MKAAVIQTRPIEGPWELPEGWRWEPLGAVVTQSSGKLRPDPTSDLPFVGLDSVEPNSTTLAATVPFSTMRSAANSFSRGDVLYGRLRPYLNKVWLADRAGACSGEFIVLQPRADLEAEYLKWLLHHGGFVRFASHAVTGDRPRIDLAKMSGYPVPLPPLDTQRRIVARIDELFSELDDGEAALARARADLEIYRKSLLKAAVTGELTADWRAANPPAETGEQLLQRILAERKARWEANPKNKGKRYSEPSAGPAFGSTVPLGWTTASVDQLARVVRGASPRPAGDPRYFGGTIPWITVGSLTADRSRYLNAVSLFVTEAGKTASRYVEPGTLLFTNSGATLGVPKITNIGGCINDGSVALLDVEEPTKSFLYFFLLTQTERLRMLNQGAAQPNLNTGIVKEIVVPLPPIEEQTRIVQLLAQALEVEDLNPTDIDGCRNEAVRLRQSILAAAFRGDLVQ